MAAQAALISDSQHPLMTHVVLRQQRTAVRDRCREIVWHALRSDGSSAGGKCRCRIKRLHRVRIRRPVRALRGLGRRCRNDIRAESSQGSDEWWSGTAIQGDGFFHAVMADGESTSDCKTAVGLTLKIVLHEKCADARERYNAERR